VITFLKAALEIRWNNLMMIAKPHKQFTRSRHHVER